MRYAKERSGSALAADADAGGASASAERQGNSGVGKRLAGGRCRGSFTDTDGDVVEIVRMCPVNVEKVVSEAEVMIGAGDILALLHQVLIPGKIAGQCFSGCGPDPETDLFSRLGIAEIAGREVAG